jgi:ABC-type sugar transport system ATPase subunit
VRVDVRNVEKSYGGSHRALADVSLSAEDAEFLVLLGPSGSGKTTLLRAVAGLESVEGGSIEFNGERVNDLDPGRRHVGMVFQDYALYPHLSVRENIAYNMRLRRIAKPEVERRVVEVAAMLGLQGLLDRKPSQLSGGQRQRVAVGRAITRDASVLLMDEPLSNLDAQVREHVRVELKQLQRRLKITTIYVTHDQVEAMVMADRIAVMANGALEQIGPPSEIYARPETLFCARFVGSPKINEVAGRLQRSEAGDLLFVIGDGGAPTILRLDPEGATPELLPAGEVTLAFRAEDTEVFAGALAPSGALAISVTLIENRGAEKFVVGLLPEALRPAQRSVDLRVRVSSGTASDRVAILPTRVHVFEAGAGRRVLTAACRVASSSHTREPNLDRWRPDPIAAR